jgi:hypothetical protein
MDFRFSVPLDGKQKKAKEEKKREKFQRFAEKSRT